MEHQPTRGLSKLRGRIRNGGDLSLGDVRRSRLTLHTQRTLLACRRCTHRSTKQLSSVKAEMVRTLEMTSPTMRLAFAPWPSAASSVLPFSSVTWWGSDRWIENI
eukprot:1142115-Pyramimonas_sp.AAC.3